jgi:hypothetical protein
MRGLAAASLCSPWWGSVEISISAAGTDWPKYKRFIHLFVNDGHVTDPPDWSNLQNNNYTRNKVVVMPESA